MLVKEILRKLDLGNSVAEFDDALESYFVETETFRKVLHAKADIVAGDKGTGKTALYKILQARANQSRELRGVAILPAFNPSGSPVFQMLTEGSPLDEATYGAVWKTYVLALVGNWFLDLVGPDNPSKEYRIIEQILSKADLRSLDHSATSVFGRIVDWAKKKLSGAKSAQLSFGVPHGPSVTPKLEFESDASSPPIRFEEALAILNRALAALGQSCWVALDRLDEAFQSLPAVELPALRALFRAYLDLMPFENIRLKLFVRRDLFRKITEGGFVNLTHVNARKIEITWDDEDLKHLLCQRVRESREFLPAIGLEKESPDDVIFAALFPDQVDLGGGRPKTWVWMMSRIRDGNGLRPPRNLIDLVTKAQDAQMRREERESNVFSSGSPIIASDAIKQGLEKLSEERVNDTLLAEVGSDLAKWIDRFRDGKAEHNDASLASVLDIPIEQVPRKVKLLEEIGFLEAVGASYKIPMLYRNGLNITQGKGFPTKEGESADPES